VTVDGHADFWVAIATISPIAIATNLLTFGQVMVRKSTLRRDSDEEPSTAWLRFTAWLRHWHMLWVYLNLAACLALIGLALQSLWSKGDAVPGWLAIALLLAMLVELCILAVCSASILDYASAHESKGHDGSTSP
jgi:heme A synthase